MKKLLNIVVILFVLFGIFGKQVLAEDSLQEQTQENDDSSIVTSNVFGSSLTPDMVSLKNKSTGKLRLLKASNTDELPAQFNLTDVVDENDVHENFTTPVKNQGQFGTCWAFSICSSAESNYKKRYSQELDLSEMHLAWYTYNNIGASDPLNLIPNSGTSLKDITKPNMILDAGSNPLIATYSLSSGIGFIGEDEMQYSDAITESSDVNTLFPQDKCYESDYILTNADWYSMSTSEDIKNVKKNIINNGAVMAYVHVDGNLLDGTNKYIFTSSSATSGANNNEANHAITIIGWDDNISADQFTKGINGEKPSINGAWIVQNSYGEDHQYKTMYISYDEHSTKSNWAASFKIEPNTQNKYHIYQYDGTALSTYEPYAADPETNKAEYTVANIYTAQNEEKIDYVGLFTYQANVTVTTRVFNLAPTVAYPENYRAQLLADELDEDNLPSNIKFVCGKTEKIENAGYHTIDFTNTIKSTIPQGNLIYVVVKYSVDNSNLLLPVETRTEYLSAEDKASMSMFNFQYQILPIDNLDTISAQMNDNNKYMIHSQGYTKDKISSIENEPDNLEETGYARIKVISTSSTNNINYVYPDGDEGDIITTTPSNPTSYIYNEGFAGSIGDGEVTLYPASWKDSNNNIKREFDAWYSDSSFNNKLENNKFSTAQNTELTFYAGFKQRVIIDYGNTDNESNDIYHLLPNEKFQLPYNKVEELHVDENNNICEFKNWKYTLNGESKTALPNEEIDLNIKINGPDIIIEPEWEPITPNSNTNDVVTIGELKIASDIVNNAFNVKIINSVSLDNLFTSEDKTNGGVVWVEAVKEEDISKCNLFDTGNSGDAVLRCVDINIFKKNSDSSINKVYNLEDYAPISIELTNEPVLKDAAENNKLLIYSIHNGKQSDQPIIPDSYDVTTGLLTFKIKEFSLFGFAKSNTVQGSYSNKPTESTTPTGETENNDNKTPETKDTTNNNNKAYPDFKPANTGIN